MRRRINSIDNRISRGQKGHIFSQEFTEDSTAPEVWFHQDLNKPEAERAPITKREMDGFIASLPGGVEVLKIFFVEPQDYTYPSTSRGILTED